mmetsp:Transcript_14955/g.37311  ORF Transcript_14955/g.37311 Transcript_14955/m.37311 type:complete len:83 (-) Transcript_14955:304-552(-)
MPITKDQAPKKITHAQPMSGMYNHVSKRSSYMSICSLAPQQRSCDASALECLSTDPVRIQATDVGMRIRRCSGLKHCMVPFC